MNTSKKKGLGRGLRALFGDQTKETEKQRTHTHTHIYMYIYILARPRRPTFSMKF